MNSSYALFLIFGFLAIVLLLEGVLLLWLDQRSPALKRVKQRLQRMASGEIPQQGTLLVKPRLLSDVAALHRILSGFSWAQRLDSLLLQAGSGQNVAQLMLSSLIGGMLAGLLLLVLAWPGLWVSLAWVLGAALPLARLYWMRAHRLQRIMTQLPEVLDLIGRALRAGHAFSSALAMVGNEAPEPLASEFKATFDEINFGISTKNALLNLANRVPVPDMRYFVLAVVIQLETGGNLAQLLSMLSHLIRERFKLFGMVCKSQPSDGLI